MAEQTGGGNNETTILATFKDQTAEGIGKLQERLKGVRSGAEGMGKAVAGSMGGGALRATEEFNRGFEKVAKGITIGVVAVKGLTAGIHGLSAAFKYFSGDIRGAKQELQEFYDSIEKTIRSLPAGDAIAEVGIGINDAMEQAGKKAGTYLSKGFKEGIRDLHNQVPGGIVPPILIPFAQGLLLPPNAKTKAELTTDAANSSKAADAARARIERDGKAVDSAFTQFGNRFSLSEIDQQLIKLRDTREKLEQEVGRSVGLRDSTGANTEAGAKYQRSLLQLDKDIELLKQQRDHAAEQQKTLLAVERAKLVDDHGSDLEALAALGEKQRQEREAYVKQFGGKGVEDLDARQGLEKVNTQIGLAADRAHEAESKLNEKLAQTAHLVETGSISIFEADRRTAAAQKEYAASIEKARDALIDMQAVATDPGVMRAIQRQIDMLPPHVSEIRKEINKLGGEIRDSLQQPTEGFFKGILTGSVSAKQAFKNMIAGFADNLASLAANKITTGLFSAILGGGSGSGAGGGLGGLIAGAFSGSTAKNAGGWIPGSGPDRDSVHAMLTPGEFVVSRRAAQAYPRLLEAINSGGVNGRMLAMGSIGAPHYNVGGFVQPASGAVGGGGGGDGVRILPAFIMTPAEGRKMVNASKDAIFELLARHPERVPRGG